MNPYKHLSDGDLIDLGNTFAGDLSFYVAGWDYANAAEQERAAARKCKRQSRPIDVEMKRRGLCTTRPSLVRVGALPQASTETG